jgi:hypothetical protein
VSLVKQVANHPIRTALLVGGIDYLREANYRQRGTWFHLPWDYTEKPIASMLQEGGAEALGVLGTTAVFGPGGDFSAKQLEEMVAMLRGKENTFETDKVKNMFWGLSQLYNLQDEFRKGNYADMLGTILLGEHRAVSYAPRRLMRDVPEWLPGMGKSELVEQAEQEQARRKQRHEQLVERRQAHPRTGIEERLRRRGLLD